ncbi:unnamed protein product [Microthlaspi erraticum]|uniref:Retrotransposon gag domain-containing protein n=1 Tax=Microthlaspi erraticum TaxID=1685480 RepID=A0A6D2HMI5_9BRAS|nr:unnamed protein product [Microthlaspi erraticum]
MAPPADDPSTRTGGLQSQLGADGNPIVHPVEVDATNGHVNPPPPPVPDVEAPVTTAALTAAMQGFAAQIASQFAEMQAQQQKYNDKIDSLHVTSDGRVIPTGRTLFQTPTRSTAATGSNAATNGEKDTDPEVAKLRRDLDAISSKVHDAISSSPEIAKILAETKRSPFTRRIAAIPLKDQTALRLQFYNNGDDPRNWLRNFEMAMRRQNMPPPKNKTQITAKCSSST